ncbi:MAG: hypothetical protein IH605_11200 [Burkholderiales bacterium]|nr:hypothetical protein [Burkholderiales bacterium]
MKMGTYAVAAIVMASGLAMLMTAGTPTTRARESAGAISTTNRHGNRPTNIGRHPESRAGGIPARYDDDVVKWIPLVVPMMAVVLAVGVFFIGRLVL